MTRLFGVIGHPIAHSLSPAMHTAALKALRCDAVYSAFDVPPACLRPILRAFVLAGVEGLNVTVPLKEAVIPLLSRIDPHARAIGAVNTIVIRNRRTAGYNTDGAGFLRAMRELGWRPAPARALLLGAGGAAKAVAWELARVRGVHLTIANRHPARAKQLARWLRHRQPRARVEVVPLHAADPRAAQLLINATTVGMRPNDRPPIDSSRLRRGTLVYDLVYHHETALVRAARRRGCVAANGVSMLLYQGAESLRLWLRRAPPIGAMRQALQRELHSTRGW
ncbi:MAG: shikimate dehydrogenase [Candidatus Omnitrophica bacterium]|nr:shikimate dehydrogenase [Candidatus Omnitrophota bacterium]